MTEGQAGGSLAPANDPGVDPGRPDADSGGDLALPKTVLRTKPYEYRTPDEPDCKRRPYSRGWVNVFIPKDFAEDLKPVAEQNNMTISDVVTVLAFQGTISMQGQQDFEFALAEAGTAVCPFCNHTHVRESAAPEEPTQ